MAKAPAKPEAAEQAPVVKSKKRLFIIIGILAVVLAGGGAAAWFFTRPAPGAHHEEKSEPAKPPVFVILDSFTVNLTPEEDGDKYLQVTLTLQVAEEKDAEEIKLHMPQVRSRILLLLSSKKASELLIQEGKTKLTQEIVKEVNKPFNPKGEPQKVTSVFFTSFVIQ